MSRGEQSFASMSFGSFNDECPCESRQLPSGLSIDQPLFPLNDVGLPLYDPITFQSTEGVPWQAPDLENNRGHNPALSQQSPSDASRGENWINNPSNYLTVDPNILSNENVHHLPNNRQDIYLSSSDQAQGDLSISVGPMFHDNNAQINLINKGSSQSRCGQNYLDVRSNRSGNASNSSSALSRRQKRSKVEKSPSRSRQSLKTQLRSEKNPSHTADPICPTVPEQQNPDNVTIAVCLLWMNKNPFALPSGHVISCLSDLFGDSKEKIRNWFSRNIETSTNDDDTGYQTMTTAELDVISGYRRNRGECNRKAGNVSIGNTRLIEFKRDESRPYACTSRCGANFQKKAAWKRHEEINHPSRLWLCSLRTCSENPKKKRTFFRRDHFKKHLSSEHRGVSIRKRDLAAYSTPIKHNYSKYCIFRDCHEKFSSWKERIDHIADHLEGPWHMSEWKDPEDEAENSADTETSDSEDSDSDTVSDGDDSEDFKDSDDSYGNGAKPPSERDDRGAGPRKGKTAYRGLDDNRDNNNRGFSGQEYNNFSTGSFAISFESRNPFKSLRPLWAPKIQSLGFLGSGSTAIVDEVCIPGSTTTFARKSVRSQNLKDRNYLKREAMIMSHFKHPHVSHIAASYFELGSTTLLMQPVAEMTLLQYLKACSSGEPVREETGDWFGCLASGLEHIHLAGVRHRDIKPSNILLKNDTVVFTDFGSSNLVNEDESDESESGDFTVQYAAPEVYQGKRGRAADVFALGCVFLEVAMLILSPDPLENLLETYRERSSQTVVAFCDTDRMQDWISKLRARAELLQEVKVSPTILDVCETMLRRHPEQRPTAIELARQIPTHAHCVKEEDVSLDQGQNEAGVQAMYKASVADIDDIAGDELPALVDNGDCDTLSDPSSVSTASLKDNHDSLIPNKKGTNWPLYKLECVQTVSDPDQMSTLTEYAMVPTTLPQNLKRKSAMHSPALDNFIHGDPQDDPWSVYTMFTRHRRKLPHSQAEVNNDEIMSSKKIIALRKGKE